MMRLLSTEAFLLHVEKSKVNILQEENKNFFKHFQSLKNYLKVLENSFLKSTGKIHMINNTIVPTLNH